MTDPRHLLGHAAEAAVEGWLDSCGWRILGRRVRSDAGGEVDLVALDPRRVLVAVEVRARRSSRAGDAAATVDQRRTRRLGATLVAIARTAPAHSGLRIDLVTAEPAPGGGWLLRRIAGIDAR